MSFKKGDRFRTKEIGATGTIEDVSFNSIHQVQEYYVRWDHVSHMVHCYMADNVDDIWEKIADQVGLPSGIITPGEIKKDSLREQQYANDGWYALDDGTISKEPFKDLDKMNCDQKGHDWATYNSGFTIYDYCKVCDKKKDF